MNELNLTPIKARLDAVEIKFGRNWKTADDDADGICFVLTEDSGNPFRVGEEFTAICETSQESPELWEFLRTGLDVQRNLIAEVERLRAKEKDGLRWEAGLAGNLHHAQDALHDAAAEIERLRKALSEANDHIAEQESTIGGLHVDVMDLKRRIGAAS